MYTQVYDVDASIKINYPQFMSSGRVFLTFVPKGEELYIESDTYLNDPITFEWSGQEALSHLDSLIVQSQHQYAC